MQLYQECYGWPYAHVLLPQFAPLPRGVGPALGALSVLEAMDSWRQINE